MASFGMTIQDGGPFYSPLKIETFLNLKENISTDQWFTIDLEVIIINIISTISCGIFGKIYFSTL